VVVDHQHLNQATPRCTFVATQQSTNLAWRICARKQTPENRTWQEIRYEKAALASSPRDCDSLHQRPRFRPEIGVAEATNVTRIKPHQQSAAALLARQNQKQIYININNLIATKSIKL
jgi:hypothetical protein